MRDRCNKNDRQHFVGHIITTVYVRGHGRSNVQGRGLFLQLQPSGCSYKVVIECYITCTSVIVIICVMNGIKVTCTRIAVLQLNSTVMKSYFTNVI